MSETEAAAGQGDDVKDEECPLCLEPLPPFWDMGRRAALTCCGNHVCVDCRDKRNAVVHGARASGFRTEDERRAADQLANTCPFCRTELPGDDAGRVMVDRFEKGQLPLGLYRELGSSLLQGGGGIETNVERGVEILMLGAKKGDPNCQYCLGIAYQEGAYGLPKSATEAKRWHLAAAEQGHAFAEYNLARLARDDGNNPEYLRYLRSSASKGCNKASYNFGVTCYKGIRGLQQSTEEAIRVLTPTAERGHAMSMGLLGTCMCCPYPNQMALYNPNFTKGMHWLRRAAEKGDETAISHLKGIEEKVSSICFRCTTNAPPEKAFLRCSRCRAAWYCSKECQVQHWKAAEEGHKQFCIKWE